MNPINPIKHNKANTHRRANARACYDAIISAPKSISITASVVDDPRIIEAHKRAVSQTLLFMESRAMTRVRKKGANTKAQHKPDGGNS